MPIIVEETRDWGDPSLFVSDQRAGACWMTRYIIEQWEMRQKRVTVVMDGDEERAGREHTRSIGLILSQSPITAKRVVRILLNGLNLVSTKPKFLLISFTLSFSPRHPSTKVESGCTWGLTLFKEGCHCDYLECEVEDIRLISVTYLINSSVNPLDVGWWEMDRIRLLQRWEEGRRRTYSKQGPQFHTPYCGFTDVTPDQQVPNK
jgi:hypothetical protein